MMIRTANTADIPSINRIEAQAATAAHWTAGTYERIFSHAGPPRLILVAEENATIMGFVIALSSGKEWEIENIAILEEARRRGLGTRLLHEVLQHAQQAGAEAFCLEVRESNQTARRFYEKLAFVGNGRRRGYYPDPQEDAILYHLPLAARQPQPNSLISNKMQ